MAYVKPGKMHHDDLVAAALGGSTSKAMKVIRNFCHYKSVLLVALL
jgi:hypothetical protein